MRDNSYDRTIERNYLQKWRFLIPEYEAVKAGRSQLFKRVGDFYRHHGTCSQTFRKYYNRYLQSGDEADLLPRRRGPKWRERREPQGIEVEIIAHRKRGMNRYEIHAVLREQRDTVPSPVTIYRVLRRHQLNRRTPAMREEKRRIIKDKLGELGHVDLHQLPRDMFLAPPPVTAYIISLIDSCSRLAWAEVLTSKKALPVMFKTLKMINTLNVLRARLPGNPVRQRRRVRSPQQAPTASLRGHAARARHQAPLHQALSAADQRQGRALLANPRRGRHRGRHLRQSRSFRRRTVRVPDLLQQP